VADGKLVIVTGASQNHARPLLNLLFSLDRHEPETPVVVYDLGLKPATLDILRRQRRNLVTFRFEDYPPHVDPDNLANYAWKPAMVHEVAQAHGFPLLYLDAGDLVHARLDRVRAELGRVGIYSSHSANTIGHWAHPLMLEAMQVEPELLAERNRNGATIGFGDHALGRELAASWYDACMKPEIICPPGATRSNHRFDQAVLSVLIARLQRRHDLALADALLDISIHNDSLSWPEVSAYLRTGQPPLVPYYLWLRRLQREKRKKPKTLLRRMLRFAWRQLRGKKSAAP